MCVIYVYEALVVLSPIVSENQKTTQQFIQILVRRRAHTASIVNDDDMVVSFLRSNESSAKRVNMIESEARDAQDGSISYASALLDSEV